MSECNIDLFSVLLKKGISTRDVHSFVQKQTKLKKVCRDFDKPLSLTAMRSKLNDACSFSHRQRRVVNKLKKDVLKATGFKRYKTMKIVKQVRELVRKEKLVQSQKNKTKIARYEKVQAQINSKVSQEAFKLPASIAQFSCLKAFSPPQNVDVPDEPPMVYDENIVLSENELKLLKIF